jgi:hypothetical protein
MPDIITTPLPFVFANNTTADATQVNTDLNTIVNGVNDNAAEQPVNSSITEMTALQTLTHTLDLQANMTLEGSLVATLSQNAVSRWQFINANAGSGAYTEIDLGNSTGPSDCAIIAPGTNTAAYAGARSINLVSAGGAIGFYCAGALQWIMSGSGMLNPANTQPWGSLTSSANLTGGGSGSFLTYTAGQTQGMTLVAANGTIQPTAAAGCAEFYATVKVSAGGSGSGTLIAEFYDETASAAVSVAIVDLVIGAGSVITQTVSTKAALTAGHLYVVNATTVSGASVSASCLEFGIRVLG